MHHRLLQAAIIVAGALGIGLAVAVVAQIWAGFPPADITAVQNTFWQNHPLPPEWYLQAQVWGLYALTLVFEVWPLMFVVIAGVLAIWLGLRLYGGSEVEMYLERIHTLEQLAADTARREEKLLNIWDSLQEGLDTVFEKSGELWLVLTPDGRIRRGNPAALGYAKRMNPALETLETAHLEALWPDYAKSPLAAAVAAAGQGTPWHGEVQLADTAAHILAWVWPYGEDVALLARDVTGKYQPESNLHNAEAMLRHLVDESSGPLAVFDTQWRYLYAAKGWQAFFGVSPQASLVGRDHAKLMPNFPPNLPQVTQQLATGQAVGNEETRITVNNREEVITWQVRPWRDGENRLGGYIFTITPVTELTRLRAQLKEGQARENTLAYSDTLTGLPNRQLFHDRLNMALATAYRQLSKVALMFIDLDGFKAVNDNLGHDYGDMLLKQVAERLKSALRDSDTVARLGGDEFTIILGVRERGDAEQVAQKVIEMLAQPFDLNGKSADIGGSLGVAMYPQDGSTAADLIKKADAAMYEAKNAGKNTYRFATKEIKIQGA